MWKIARSLVTENPGTKIISVVLGLAIWLHVNRQLHPLEKERVVVEVGVVNVGGNLVPRVAPEQLEVAIWGDKQELRQVRPYLRELEAVVDAAGKGVGEYETEPELAGLPSGIRRSRIRVSPSRVRLTLQKRASKSLDVSWIPSSPPPQGIDIADPVIKPQTVAVEGLEEELRLIGKAQVEIPLAGVEKGNTSWLPVHLYDAQGRPLRKPALSIQPPLVSVTVPIAAVLTKVVPVVPQVEKAGEGFEIEEVHVSPAAVTLSGGREALAPIDHVPTETMSVAGEQEKESRRLRLALPAGVRAVGGADVQVTVAIRRLSTPPLKPPPDGEEGAGEGKAPAEAR